MKRFLVVSIVALGALALAAPAKAEDLDFQLGPAPNTIGSWSVKVERLSSNEFIIRKIQANANDAPRVRVGASTRAYSVDQVRIEFIGCETLDSITGLTVDAPAGGPPFAGVSEANAAPGGPFAAGRGWRRDVLFSNVTWTADVNADGNDENDGDNHIRRTANGHRIWSQLNGAIIHVPNTQAIAEIHVAVSDGGNVWDGRVQVDECHLIPEPASLALMLPGALPLALALRRRLSRGRSEDEEEEIA